MTTILCEGRETQVDTKDSGELWLQNNQVEEATGWTMKPEGFCKGDLCVPVSDDALTEGDRVNLSGLWAYMGKPAVSSRGGDVWSLGEAADERNSAMLSLEAPDFCLPDLDGKLHTLHDFRRKKVLLITWASW
jgi:hypothetical protein